MDLIRFWQFVYNQKEYILAGGITLTIFLFGYVFGYVNAYVHWRKKAYLLTEHELKEENIRLKQQLDDHKTQIERVIKIDPNMQVKIKSVV